MRRVRSFAKAHPGVTIIACSALFGLTLFVGAGGTAADPVGLALIVILIAAFAGGMIMAYRAFDPPRKPPGSV